MIQLAGVDRTYIVGGSPVRALREVTLTIETGEYVSIMGPSGSGKSTLLHILGCLDRPTAGSYRLTGVETATATEPELSQLRRHQIGFIFSILSPGSAPYRIGQCRITDGVRGRAAGRTASARPAVPRRRWPHAPRHTPPRSTLRWRAATRSHRRAIVMDPAILLADEPTGNLDSTSGREIVTLIESMNQRGLTLIIVTHDPQIGERARRRIRLKDGLVVGDERFD